MKSFEALSLIKKVSPGLIKCKPLKYMYLDRVKARLTKFDGKLPHEVNRNRLGMKKDAYNKLCGTYKLASKANRTYFIKKLWNPEMTAHELAELFGVGYNVVSQWKRNLKLKCLKHKGAKINRIDNKKIVCFLRDNGFTLQEIANLYKVTRERVRQMGIGR